MKKHITVELPLYSNDLEVNYDTTCHCFGDVLVAGCEPDVCRGSTISDPYVNVSSFDYKNFRLNIIDDEGKEQQYTPTPVEIYCIDKLVKINGGLENSNFDFTFQKGFYGEEIDEIIFRNKEALCSDVKQMLEEDTDIEKIFFILKKEYGFIHYIIKDCKQVDIIKERPCNIKSCGHTPLQKQLIRIDNLGERDIVGVVKGNLMLDGNHRIGYLYDKGIENTPFRYISIS